jgi:TM2 domain-containing membrane protein YozV
MVEWILNPREPVDKNKALLILILNIIPLPGLGTIIYGRVLRGIVELLTSWIIIGFIFAVIDGVQLYTKATSGKTALTPSN